MNKEVAVAGFTDKLRNILKVSIAQAAVVHDCQCTGNSYVFHINNALYIKNMSSNLISHFMLILNGIDVNECPKYTSCHPEESHHLIYFDAKEDLQIHLHLDGTTSYIPTQKIILEADLRPNYEYLDLTPDTEDWNPHDATFGDQEKPMLDFQGHLHDRLHFDLPFYSEVSSVLSGISSTLDVEQFHHALMDTVSISSVSSSNRRYHTDVDTIMRVFRCSRDTVKRTLNVATQRCTRSSINPSLSHRFHTNDRMLSYPRISCDMFMDTHSFANQICERIYLCSNVFHRFQFHPY